jgi:thiamine-phosphate pyrophosphorylase
VSRAPQLPRLYAIVDSSLIGGYGKSLLRFAEELVKGGATLIQYRNKTGSSPEVLSESRELRRAAPAATLIMNDRPDLCLAAGFDGVHLGQEDLSPTAARKILGPGSWIGVSAHNLGQVKEADARATNYVAIGPVFATRSKRNPDPVIGLDGVRAARAATRKPLVAIGGITRANCRDVIEAGADCVAVISDLVGSPRKSVEAFLRNLE